MTDLFEEIVKMRRVGARGALATIVHTNGSIPSYESSRMLVREDGSIAGTIGGGCVEADVWAAAKEVMQKELPRKMVFNLNHEASYDSGLICGGTLEIFVEPILPQPVVYLFGGGHVSIAVANAASAAGFGIAVVDDREAFANMQRFPMAQAVHTSYAGAFEKIRPNASSYLIIVTRGHKEDMRVLAWAVRTQARYIGIIGSKRKVLSVYKALEILVTKQSKQFQLLGSYTHSWSCLEGTWQPRDPAAFIQPDAFPFCAGLGTNDNRSAASGNGIRSARP